jgi:hypothetical protein
MKPVAMRAIPRAAYLAFILLSASFAQDAVFEKSELMGASSPKTTSVELVVTNTGVTIRSKGQVPSVIQEIPYSSVNNLGYTFVDRGKSWMIPIMGPSALFIKGQTHWLVIESTAGAAKTSTVLRLDKAEYREVIAALTARSGKRVEMLAPGSTLVDPTIGSHDEDHVVPFPIDQVRAAIKPAMERSFCKVSGSKQDRIQCTRGFRPPNLIGGGEGVTATLEAQGQQTQVLIKTAKGWGKNWSTPVYVEMLRNLQAPR